MQGIYLSVLSTSYVFLPCNIDFPNLSQQIYFFGGNCIQVQQHVQGVVSLVFGIKYGLTFIF